MRPAETFSVSAPACPLREAPALIARRSRGPFVNGFFNHAAETRATGHSWDTSAQKTANRGNTRGQFGHAHPRSVLFGIVLDCSLDRLRGDS